MVSIFIFTRLVYHECTYYVSMSSGLVRRGSVAVSALDYGS